jgi:hypothetical protein
MGDRRTPPVERFRPEFGSRDVGIALGLILLVAFDLAAWRWGVDSNSWAEDELRRSIRPLPRRAL